MAISSKGAQSAIERLLERGSAEQIVERLGPVAIDVEPLSREIPEPRNWGSDGVARRRQFIADELGVETPHLAGEKLFGDPASLKGHIENYIGMTQVPTGIIGPLRVNGVDAKGDYYVPLATTEGALVASYHRGAQLVSRAGGVTSICITER
ncbi:MAG: 3-hydroxy-3-methylglutaryl-CoA reductase, partial [bacterium]|nr:3-hydroxy-3-methylglutaryl-CoA reductase [Candidatus Kapabacteria bacterium]